MKEKENRESRVPGWFSILILITALPILAWPWLMGQATVGFAEGMTDDSLPWVLLMLLPLYVVLSTWCSYRVYGSWRVLAWVLQALQILVYLAISVLVL